MNHTNMGKMVHTLWQSLLKVIHGVSLGCLHEKWQWRMKKRALYLCLKWPCLSGYLFSKVTIMVGHSTPNSKVRKVWWEKVSDAVQHFVSDILMPNPSIDKPYSESIKKDLPWPYTCTIRPINFMLNISSFLSCDITTFSPRGADHKLLVDT